jgi:hypothetical protein
MVLRVRGQPADGVRRAHRARPQEARRRATTSTSRRARWPQQGVRRRFRHRLPQELAKPYPRRCPVPRQLSPGPIRGREASRSPPRSEEGGEDSAVGSSSFAQRSVEDSDRGWRIHGRESGSGSSISSSRSDAISLASRGAADANVRDLGATNEKDRTQTSARLMGCRVVSRSHPLLWKRSVFYAKRSR